MAMKREIISITDEGAIVSPNSPHRVRMTAIEIAALLGIYYPTVKRHICAIEESGIAGGDYTMTCTVGNMTVRPEYYGLEMIVAVAFRVKSWQADKFRQWLMERAMQPAPKFQSPIRLLLSMSRVSLSD
jgi:hypothetical protein